VGFDIDDFAWSQHAFVLEMIDRAAPKHRREALDDDPPFVQAQLQVLRHLVGQYQVSYVEPNKTWRL
jgi:hypothetical protein